MSQANHQTERPPFELGQPLFLKPDFDAGHENPIYVPVGFHRGMFTGWIADCVLADDPTGYWRPIPCGCLTSLDPYEGLGKVLDFARTSTGVTLTVLQGGRFGE